MFNVYILFKHEIVHLFIFNCSSLDSKSIIYIYKYDFWL